MKDYWQICYGKQRFVWWDHRLWYRTYTEGGYDGYQIAFSRKRLPCGELARRIAACDTGRF